MQSVPRYLSRMSAACNFGEVHIAGLGRIRCALQALNVRRVAIGLVETHSLFGETPYRIGADFVSFVQLYRSHLVLPTRFQTLINLEQALPLQKPNRTRRSSARMRSTGPSEK